jgi:hypothetical protein
VSGRRLILAALVLFATILVVIPRSPPRAVDSSSPTEASTTQRLDPARTLGARVAMKANADPASVVPQGPTLRLPAPVVGPGVVRGRVRDTLGRPSSGLDLCILAAAADDDAGSFVVPQAISAALEREGRGRYWATTTTAADGSFEARGLRADRFVVRARTDRESGYPLLLTPVSVESNGVPLELLLDRPYIAVRVVDADGNPWAGEIGVGARFWVRPVDDWPAVPQVVVAPSLADAQLGDPESLARSGKRVGHSELVFEVSEGRRYEVGLLGGSASWKPQEVEVPSGSSRIDVTLAVPASVRMGAVVVSAHGTAGDTLAGGVAIRIEDPTSGVPLLLRDNFEQPRPQRFSLPEGTYRVVVEGAASTDPMHGTLESPRSCGRVATTVRVESERTTEVLAEVPAGARLHLVLRGETREEDRRAIRARKPYLDSGSVDAWAKEASIVLVFEGSWPIPVEFARHLGRTSSAGTELISHMQVGAEGTSQTLPAGGCRLEARLPGGRIASQAIELLDGRLAEVTLVFAP